MHNYIVNQSMEQMADLGDTREYIKGQMYGLTTKEIQMYVKFHFYWINSSLS